MALPVITLSSTDTVLSMLTGGTANLKLETDLNFPSVPAIVTLTLQATGLIPGIDFDMPQFTWVDSGAYYTGTYDIAYDDITTLVPLIFTITPIRNSQYGTLVGNIEIIATADYDVDVAAHDEDYTLVGIWRLTYLMELQPPSRRCMRSKVTRWSWLLRQRPALLILDTTRSPG